MNFKIKLLTFLISLGFIPNKIDAQQVNYTLKPQYNLNHISSFSERLARAEKSYEKVGFIDKTGKFVIEAQFEETGVFHNGLSWVAKTNSISGKKKYGYIDKKGKMHIDYQFDKAKDFSNKRAAVKIDGRWSYINKNAKVVFKSTSEMSRKFQDDLLLQKRDGKFGYVDRNGKTTIPFKYDNAHHFSDGLAIVSTSEKQEENSKGKDTLDKIYQSLPGGPHKEYIKQVIDTNGKTAFQLPSNLERLENFHNGMAAFRVAGKKRFSRGKWGVINSKGEIVFEPQFKHKPHNFSEGIAFVQVEGRGNDPKEGYIYTLNKQGAIIAKIPLMDSKRGLIQNTKSEFHEGLLAVAINVEPNTTYSRWGYMDKHGKMLIKAQFSSALNFFEGLAIVVKDGAVGIIENPL